MGAVESQILQTVYDQLLAWCREHDFAGHDPFDALNSRVFQSTPFSKSRSARLAWTQLVKRSPADLRKLASVPEQRNAKGLAVLIALQQRARFIISQSITPHIFSVLDSSVFLCPSGLRLDSHLESR